MAHVSIDSAPWREETMIGWVVRFDGTWKRRIVRLGFHPTQLFNPSLPNTRPIASRPIDEQVRDFATGRTHRRTKRQTRHEAILHADD